MEEMESATRVQILVEAVNVLEKKKKKWIYLFLLSYW